MNPYTRLWWVRRKVTKIVKKMSAVQKNGQYKNGGLCVNWLFENQFPLGVHLRFTKAICTILHRYHINMSPRTRF